MKRFACTLTLLSFCVQLGCSNYLPLTPPPPPPAGIEVRARLTNEGAVATALFFGTPRLEVEGQLLEWSPGEVLLGIPRPRGLGPSGTVDTLTVSTADVLFLEEKRLSRGRTAAFVVASSVAIGAIVIGLFKAAGGSQNGDDGPIDLARIPPYRP